MIRRPPRSTRTEHTLSLHDALPIYFRLPTYFAPVAPSARKREVWVSSCPSTTSKAPSSGATWDFIRRQRLNEDSDMRTLMSAMGTARAPVSATRLGHSSDSIQIAASGRSEEHTSELQSLMRISYAVFCLKKKKHKNAH